MCKLHWNQDGDSRVDGYDGEQDIVVDDEDNLETSKEEEEEDDGAFDTTDKIFDEEEDEENVKVVGKKRKALRAQYDPVVIRRRQLRDYRERRKFFSCPTSALMVNIIKIRGVSITPEVIMGYCTCIS